MSDLGWMLSRVSRARLPPRAPGALGPLSGLESEPWAAGVPQAPELPRGWLWNLGSGSRLPPMAFLKEREPCSRRLRSALGAGSRDTRCQPGRREGWRLQSCPARGLEALPAEKEARGVCASRGAGSPQAWGPRSPVTWIHPCPSSLPTQSAAATCSFSI